MLIDYHGGLTLCPFVLSLYLTNQFDFSMDQILFCRKIVIHNTHFSLQHKKLIICVCAIEAPLQGSSLLKMLCIKLRVNIKEIGAAFRYEVPIQ